jgi:hypothetical protein
VRLLHSIGNCFLLGLKIVHRCHIEDVDQGFCGIRPTKEASSDGESCIMQKLTVGVCPAKEEDDFEAFIDDIQL